MPLSLLPVVCLPFPRHPFDLAHCSSVQGFAAEASALLGTSSQLAEAIFSQVLDLPFNPTLAQPYLRTTSALDSALSAFAL